MPLMAALGGLGACIGSGTSSHDGDSGVIAYRGAEDDMRLAVTDRMPCRIRGKAQRPERTSEAECISAERRNNAKDGEDPDGDTFRKI